jgi:prephenate dehydrogenase
MTLPFWNRVTVVGCGLIGGSFALAMRRAKGCNRIAGWDRSPGVLKQALKAGIIDDVDNAFPNGIVSSSDLIYLAMPVGEIARFLKEYRLSIKDGAVITDAGSTKVEICSLARAHLGKGHRFIGGHPIAGSHLSGISQARADLFEDQPYILVTEAEDANTGTLMALRGTLETLGARVYFLTAEEHDRAMAFVSHLPQLISTVLARVVAEQPGNTRFQELAGAGYRDMTRLAGSPWSIWQDILGSNANEITLALDAFIEKLFAVRSELVDGAGNANEVSLLQSLFEKLQLAE